MNDRSCSPTRNLDNGRSQKGRTRNVHRRPVQDEPESAWASSNGRKAPGCAHIEAGCMPERLHDLDDVPDTGGLSPGSATQPSPSCRLGGLHHAVVGRLGIAAPGSGVKASRQGCRECRRQARGRQQGAELRAGVGACGGLNCRTHINKTAATSRCRCLPGESALFPAPFARGTLCTAFLWRLSEPESRDLEDSVILIRFTFLCCCQKPSSHCGCQDDMGNYTLGVRHFARGMRTREHGSATAPQREIWPASRCPDPIVRLSDCPASPS